MSPELELYNLLYEGASTKGYQVYDHLPLENETAPYPFVIVGDVTTTPAVYKDGYSGRYDVTIDIWGDGESRLKVSQIMESLVPFGQGFFATKNYYFQGRGASMQKRILADTSVPDTVLTHGVLEMVFQQV
ncbi:DUF3168 domain-containing protein [Limosilactobacillus fermentum]